MELPKVKARVGRWTAVLIALFGVGFPDMGSAAAGEKVPTFAKDVAPILFKNCLRCHGLEGIASRVPLTSYDKVQPRAETIMDKVMTRQMPPWPADPAKSVKFRNDARLSQQDIDTIVAWVNAGAPKGDDADLPPAPRPESGWMQPFGRKPDLVIALPGDVYLPATGELQYVRLLIKVPFDGDRWVVASQTRPSNPAVVHHLALTEVTLPDGMRPTDVEQVTAIAQQVGIPVVQIGPKPAVTTPAKPELIDMLGIYTPGSTLEIYGEGSGKLLKGGKNMYLNFNVHYETTGKPEMDRSAIAFWFQPAPPEHQLFRVNGAAETILANGRELLTDDLGVKAEGTHVAIPPIPPFAENYELIGMTAYPEAVTIYQFQPHAHHRGKDFMYTVVYPDGREEILLSVPKYDHRWQVAYEPVAPVKLPAGSKLVVTAHYDNSMMHMNTHDHRNSMMNMQDHKAEKEVYFRDQNQSWDEMFTPFIQLSIDDQNPAKPGKNRSLEVGEVVGCLESGFSGAWTLSHASEAAISDTQGTTSVALRAAEAKPLGTQRYPLLGTSAFHPADHQAEKVAVKGVLIRGSNQIRINVTSLQKVGAECVK